MSLSAVSTDVLGGAERYARVLVSASVKIATENRLDAQMVHGAHHAARNLAAAGDPRFRRNVPARDVASAPSAIEPRLYSAVRARERQQGSSGIMLLMDVPTVAHGRVALRSSRPRRAVH